MLMLEDLHVAYVEFCDNIDGSITSPDFYRDYCLPAHQRYTDILHKQGKKVGSHTDGNLKPLLFLLAESGLDVLESFTPSPITDCSFEEAWQACVDGLIIWGGIPSSFLEPITSEDEFRTYIEKVVNLVRGSAFIFGIGDMVMPDANLNRIRTIAALLEEIN